MTEQDRALAAARAKLCQAIGLSQAQFADPNGEGLDSGALIAAIDTFEASIRAALQAHDTRVARGMVCTRCNGKGRFHDGGEIRALRKRAGLTQGDVARMVGLSVPYISDLERGNRPLSDDLASRVVAALEATAPTEGVE